MDKAERIQVFDSQGDHYKKAFQVFLDNTDQKRNAKRWLNALIEKLTSRNVFIDAGAGNGEITRVLREAFQWTIAIEPNAYLFSQLQHAIPTAETLCRSILTATPSTRGDLVLCSHTLYYIEASQWLEHLERLVSWMTPTGVTVIVLQNRETGCMGMLDHFFGHRFDLGKLADAFQQKHGSRYEILTTLDQAHVEVKDFASAYTVAEFILNLLPITEAPTRTDVEAYITRHFLVSDGDYRFPVHQDFLEIRERQ